MTVSSPKSQEGEQENRRLREELAVLRDEAKQNSRILVQSQQRELELLQAESLAQLLEAVVQGLRASYGVEAMTLVFSDPQHEVRHLLISDNHPPEQFEGVHFVDGLAGMAPQFASFYRPWLGPFIGSDHQLLFPGREDLESIALLPLRRQQNLFGSLNFGSTEADRFTRHHGTEFLHHLANVVGVCLENAINRARLVRSGLTDVLTGWHNRRYLQTRLKEELARAQRGQAPLSCLLMDVDHFKRVNDRWGHPAGDRVLREIAERVELQVRASDVAARYGGEEFAMLLPNTPVGDAQGLAERIREAVADGPVVLDDGTEVPVTVSIGIASVVPDKGASDLKSLGERLIAEADVQLYRAKSDGRNRVCLDVAAAG